MIAQDLRLASRQLRKSPGFTLTALLTRALGIGALTAVATWTNAVLFNPWPQARDARSLLVVSAIVLDGFDPVSYSGSAVLLALTVLFGDLLLARRAATIEPMQALRTE